MKIVIANVGAGLWIVLAAIVILLILIISMYNKFVKMRNSVEEAYSTMDVYLKKRYDLIPNLVETVKGYASHEKETLENVINARNRVQNAATVEDKIAGENQLGGSIKNLFALAESYPELKANENFLNLQDQLNGTEEDIANARKYYNALVKQLNTKCEMFPWNIVASVFGFKRQPLYEVDNAEERQNVKVQF